EYVAKVTPKTTNSPAKEGAQALLTGLPYTVFFVDTESVDSLVVNTGSSPTTVTVDPFLVDPSSAEKNATLPAAIALPGHITVNDAPSPNVFNIKSTTGITVINGNGGNNVFNVGSNAPAGNGTLGNIMAALTLNGSGGADSATIDDSGDGTGQTGALSST